MWWPPGKEQIGHPVNLGIPASIMSVTTERFNITEHLYSKDGIVLVRALR